MIVTINKKNKETEIIKRFLYIKLKECKEEKLIYTERKLN